MRKRAISAAALAIATLQGPALAEPGDVYRFAISFSNHDQLFMSCTGPWFRTSGCQRIPVIAPRHAQFYWANDNEFSAVGQWTCTAYLHGGCDLESLRKSVTFCGPGLVGYDQDVELELKPQGRDGYRMTVNQPPSCPAAKVTAALGQNGEDSAAPARDRDTFRFAGKPGEKVKVALDRDGGSGSAGEVATLRVRTPGGGVLGQRTGGVPLALEATLPGPVEITVLRQPGEGDAFRGYYSLEVAPRSGDVGNRQLVPTLDVEQ